jgi:hypothetical protein
MVPRAGEQSMVAVQMSPGAGKNLAKKANNSVFFKFDFEKAPSPSAKKVSIFRKFNLKKNFGPTA